MFIPQLVKDIRRLVDNGEFLSSKHAKSPVVKLMVTLLLELITDHSREVYKNDKMNSSFRLVLWG